MSSSSDHLSCGVYFIASDSVREMTLAFLNSFRAFNPTLPLCLIPFDDKFSGIAELQDEYGFSVFSDEQVLRECDSVSRDYYDRSRGQFRKLATWQGPFERFAYIDVDTVVLSEFMSLFALLDDFDVITGHACNPGLRRWVWRAGAEEAGVLTPAEIAYSGAAGFFLSSRAAVTKESLRECREVGRRMKQYMVLECLDQPFSNVVFVRGAKRRSSLSLIQADPRIGRLPMEVWAGLDGELVQRDGSYYAGSDKVLFLHWAGVWQRNPTVGLLGSIQSEGAAVGEIPHQRLWRHFRDLRASPLRSPEE